MKTNKTSIFNRGGSLLAALTAYHVVVAIFVLTLVTGAGSLIGSNMGFKATRDFDQNVNPAAANEHIIGLPHNNPWIGQGGASPYGSDAGLFLHDICVGPGGPYPYISLSVYDNSIAQFIGASVGSTCSTITGAFDFVEGGSVTLGLGSGSIPGVVLVGSQDPAFPPGGTEFTVNADPAAANIFYMAVTPNTKWTSAFDLLHDMCEGPDGTGGTDYPYIGLARYDNAIAQVVGASVGSTCSTITGDFPLVPFEGYVFALAGTTVPRIQEPYY